MRLIRPSSSDADKSLLAWWQAKEYLLAGLARLVHVPHVEALRARLSLRLARLSQDPAPLTTVVAELEGSSSGATVRLLRADVLAEIAIISNSVPRWNSAKAAYKSLAVLSSRLHYAIAEYRFMYCTSLTHWIN